MIKDHNSLTFTNRISRKTRNGKQPTALQGYIKKKRKIDNNFKDKTEKQQNVMKFASDNIETDVKYMCLVSVKIKYCNFGNVAETYDYLIVVLKAPLCSKNLP